MLACLTAPLLASDDEVAIVFTFVTMMVITVVTVVMSQWRRQREAAYVARLKQIMIERGMSAQEIETVIRASPGKRGCEPPFAGGRPPRGLV